MPFASKVIIAVAALEAGFLLWYLLMFLSMWRGSKNGRDKVGAWLSMVDLSRLIRILWFVLFLLFAFDLQTAQFIPSRLLWFLAFRVMLSLFKALAVTKLAWHLKGKQIWAEAEKVFQRFKRWLRNG